MIHIKNEKNNRIQSEMSHVLMQLNSMASNTIKIIDTVEASESWDTEEVLQTFRSTLVFLRAYLLRINQRIEDRERMNKCRIEYLEHLGTHNK